MTVHPEIESTENLAAMEDRLRNHLYEEAWVKDIDTGYIVFPSMSLLINVEMQEIAAKLVSHKLRQSGIDFDVAVGIPSAGNYFVPSVARILNLDIVPGRKYSYEKKEEDKDEGEESSEIVPGSWDNTVIIGPVPSFTTGVPSMFAFNIEPGKKVLLVDDVIAEGRTMAAIAVGLMGNGEGEGGEERNKVIAAVSYISKEFQGGVSILEDLSISTHFAVGISHIENIDGDPKPVFTAPQFPPK